MFQSSVATLFSLDDSAESTNYLEATNDSSGTNSICSFDAPPDVSPPVPPRTMNPPRNPRIAVSEHLIIIDSDDTTDLAPKPAARTKPKMPLPPMSQPQPPPPSSANSSRINFESSFIQNTNSLNLQKNSMQSQSNSRDSTDQSKSSEVRRHSSTQYFHFNIKFIIFSLAFFYIFLFFLAFCVSMCRLKSTKKNAFIGIVWWLWCKIYLSA